MFAGVREADHVPDDRSVREVDQHAGANLDSGHSFRDGVVEVRIEFARGDIDDDVGDGHGGSSRRR